MGFVATAAILHGSVPDRHLMLWLSAGLLVIAVRLVLSELGGRLLTRLRDRLIATLGSVFLMGCVWGAMALFWHEDISPVAQLVITMFPFAVSILSIVSFANWLPVYAAMALPAQIPIIVVLAICPDPGIRALVIPSVVLMMSQFALVRRVHIQLRENIELKFGNDALVRDLSERKAIHIDQDRLQQALVALLDKAVKFTDAGRVDLRFATSGGSNPRLYIIVEDSGIGISAEDQAKVFDLFTQADESNVRRHGGIGLGLTLASQLIQMMGGQLDLWSSPGVGTRMTIELPMTQASIEDVDDSPMRLASELSAAKSQLIAPATPGGAANSSSQRVKILVAEGNKVNQLVLESLLDTNGMDVRFVENGQEAVSAVLAHEPDLVLMDCQMPVMDGYDATDGIRKAGSSVPITRRRAGALAGRYLRSTACRLNDSVVVTASP